MNNYGVLCLKKKYEKRVNMNFVIDIGNSNIAFAVYKAEEPLFSQRIKTAKKESLNFFYDRIQTFFAKNKINFSQIEKIALSSVVPELTQVFAALFENYFQSSLMIVKASSDLGLSYPVEKPDFIGSDLVVCSYAAWQKYQKNCLICDLGTATTLHLVGADGFYHGSIIAPGVHTSAKALFAMASQLSEIELEEPPALLGKNTKDSILSGIVTGNRTIVDGLIIKIRREYSRLGDIMTIATGGLADLICKGSAEIDLIDDNLLLDGLNLICRNIDF